MPINTIKDYFLSLQSCICKALEAEDGKATFHKDTWIRPEGGGGHTCTIARGAVFEKAGVNFSHVEGSQLPPTATLTRPELKDCPFQALGVSLVLHPLNPHVPTVHLNVRYFEARPQGKCPIWWFGGGMDLTPYYGYKEDARFWHQACYNACENTPGGTYQSFKQQCDAYFFLKHRNEARGIGGLFFDDLSGWGFEACFSFVQALGNAFLAGYLPIVQKRKAIPYTEQERWFQAYRRGRYVEFNLLYDRGTLFGLQSQGRTESILVSLPPEVRWEYNWEPSPGSREALLYSYFLKPQDWLNQEALCHN